jgi:uncharacterized protein GlcG (DUF336 family)
MLDFDTARRLADEVLAQGRVLDCAPLAVAVVDPSGTPLVLFRTDGAPPMWGRIAQAKARTALDFGRSTAQVQRMVRDHPDLMRAIAPLSEEPVIAAAGGIVVRHKGRVVGAIGVSGDTSENDAACARHAAELLGFEGM